MPLKKIYSIAFFLLFFLSGALYAQVTADFTVNNSTGCGNLTAQFSDQSFSSGGTIVSWEWSSTNSNFTSSQQNPVKVFAIPGSFEICLKVTDSAGNQGETCKSDFITVNTLPQPDFTVSSPGGCSPAQITFSDASIPGDAEITSWVWGLNGSCSTIENSTAEDVSCTYTAVDDYAITLQVTDANGCLAYITKDTFISVTPPPTLNANNLTIDGNIGCDIPHTANFSYDLNDPAVALTWDFGNGETFEGTNPEGIEYDELGVYPVTIIAKNIESLCADTLVLDNAIRVGSEASFTASATKGCEDVTVFSFTDTSPEAATSVEWDFGDGNTSVEANPTHIYNTTGCFTVTLNRTLASGCGASVTLDTCIQIDFVPIVSEPVSSPNQHCELPYVVSFNFSEYPGVEVSNWVWDFGDGSTSSEQNPSHTYTEYGTYPVTLTVYNEAGCERKYEPEDLVVSLQEFKAIIDDVNISGCTPLSVSLSESSETTSFMDSWNWEIVSEDGAMYTSTLPTPTISVIDTGIYDVRLIARNTQDCIDTVVLNDVIEVGMLPVIDFTADPLETCIEWDVEFTDNSSPFVEEWFWDFSNGQNSSSQNSATSYLDTGYYDISLVGVHNGCANSLSKNDYVRVMAPVSKFEVINFCQEPFKRKFQNTSIDANFVEWDFGVPGVDTDVSTEENPEFYYPEVGTYEVVLTVYNSETGCSHESSETVIITNPAAGFTVENTQGCVPFNLPIVQTSADATSYAWSADGAVITSPAAANPGIKYNNSGTFSGIQLIITDVNSCKDTVVFTEDIFVGKVTTSFVQDITGGCMPLAVDFEDNSTSLYSEVVQWEWDFGNNLGSSTEQNPNFIFEQAGLHNVSLTATDEWGCSKTETVIAAVEVTNPIANFTVPAISCTWAPLAFNNTSQGVNLDYFWDFGDGMTSSEENPSHLFSAEGDYTVCLTITDKYNCVDTKCLDNPINIADPVASFAVDSTFASCPPLPVNFYNQSENTTSYTWDYGDNSGLSSLIDPSHLYTIPGTYNVTLIAERTAACIDTFSSDGLIVLEGPEGTYSFDIDTACAPATITFTAESVDNYMYIWDFGEGILDTTQLSATNEVVTYTFSEPGVYTPILSFLNNTGCFRPLPLAGSIVVSSSTPDFIASSTVLCNPGETIVFQDQSEGITAVESIEWLFEGGTPATSTSFEPVVTYEQPGEFDVTMIIYNGSCYDTLTKVDYIKLGEAPNINFSVSAVSGCAPLTVNFMDNSTSSSSNIVNWFWDFGDGNTSTLQNPTNIFNGANGSSFTTSLTITTSDGCTGSFSQQINLLAVSEITAGEDVTVCLGETTILNGVIYGDTTGLDYFWTPSESLSCTSCLNPVASPQDTTTYAFIVRTPEGCTSTSEVTVQVKPYPLPVVDISEDTTICLNSFTQLQVSGGDEVFSYDWDTSSEGLSCYENCLNPIASPTEITTYRVTVTTVHGCSATDSVLVDVIDESVEFAGIDRTICAGDTIHLGVNTGFDPYWIVNDYLDCSSCDSPVATPLETTNYKVRVTTNSGCEIIDSVLITAISQDDVDAGDFKMICANDAINLSGRGEGIVSWSPTESLDDPTILDPVASPSGNTTYELRVENGECVLTDTVSVFIKDKVEITTEDLVICQGDSIQLIASGDATAHQWMNITDSVVISGDSVWMAPTSTTKYRVIGTNSTCISDTSIMTVTVNTVPDVVLDQQYPFFSGLDFTITTFPNEAESNDYEYLWTSTAEVPCPTCQNLDLIAPTEAAIYQLQVTNRITGCVSTYETTIRPIKKCPEELINVPTAFSPNDDGVNDYLQVFPHPILPGINNVKVFNRWGALVYDGERDGDTWDGVYNGEPADAGVYIYVIEANCPATNGTFIKKGDITIMR